MNIDPFFNIRLKTFKNCFYSSILLGLCSACTNIPTIPANHVLSLDQEGKKDCGVLAIPSDTTPQSDINCNNDSDSTRNIEQHLKQIQQGIREALNKATENNPNGKVEILLFVHGGMVAKENSAAEAKAILQAIEHDNAQPNSKQPYIYPIFINWESSMGEAYKDHLFRVRQGREANYLGPISAPLYLSADLGRAFSRSPITYGYQGYNALKYTVVDTPDSVDKLNQEFLPDHQQISLGLDTTSLAAKNLEKSTYVFPGVFKLFTTPVLDMVGKSSWENMLRRTKLLFRTPDDYPDDFSWNYPATQSLNYRNSSGGLSQLMRALQVFKPLQQQNRLSVTLIGHSMGTIVLSDLLRHFNDDRNDLVYSDIVFMAAACTLRDFEDAVIPYLERHDNTHFYNLTLHPVAEENENVAFDLVPRGSLLVWIDDFASNPATRTDLTLGKWNNAKNAWPFIPVKLRHQVTLKAFGIEDAATNRGADFTLPQKHGEFNDVATGFWRKDYWQMPHRHSAHN